MILLVMFGDASQRRKAVNESDLWKYIKTGMIGKWHASRIESSAGNGIPDISFGVQGKNGWIELKYIREWPKRQDTKVKLPLRPEQKHWIKNRGQVSGDVWVLCRIHNEFFLLDYRLAMLAVEGWTKQEWIMNSVLHWRITITFETLAEMLTIGCREDKK